MLRNLRSSEIVRQVGDMRMDFGLVRRDAVPVSLKSKSLGRLTYSLIVPKAMVRPGVEPTARWVLENLPLASVEVTGEYGRRLQDAVAKAKLRLNIRVECDSLPAVCRAVASESCAAVLPTLAKDSLPAERFSVLPSPLFASMARDIHLVWNARALRVREAANGWLNVLAEQLRF